jgi:hypothetical protein
MIPERYQVTATRKKTGEIVTGYLVYRDGYESDIVVPVGNTSSVTYTIDEMTIHPVAVKPIRMPWEYAARDDQYRHFCPNCETECKVVNDQNKLEYALTAFGQPDYCPFCGQRLDWRF